jgi:tetratricopeptide (TPR) repeat protein
MSPAPERDRLAAADAFAASGDVAAARRALLDVIGAGQSPRASWKLGALLQAAGDQAGAAQALEQAAPHAVVGAARLLTTVGRLRHTELNLEAAAAAYERRVDRQPNSSAAHYDLADVYRARDDRGRDDALSALAEAAAAALLDPASGQAFAMIGQLHAAAGRDADAVAMLRRAVALAPDDAEARYAYSRALLRTGQAADAQAELETFKRLQSQAMAEERRRFVENQQKIADVLRPADGKGEGKDSAR